MFRLFYFILFISLSTVSKSFIAEVDLKYEDSSKNLKIVCFPLRDGLNMDNKHDVLWYGTHFNATDQQNLSEELQSDILLHNMTVKGSKRHRCYLLAPKNLLRRLGTSKRRLSRDDSSAPLASVPLTEDGICPPGHRIDADRCFPCFPGSFSSGQETKCFLCPKDFYMVSKAADSCWPCPQGKKTLAQGADSEESCVVLDETGHAVIEQKPPWIAIFAVIGFIILCIWILITYFCIKYWKKKKIGEDVDEEELLKSRKVSVAKKQRSSDGHLYHSISDTDVEEPIYAEIGDFESGYEEPRRPSAPADYLDLEAPPPPPRRKLRRDSIPGEASEQISEDQYEIPIMKGRPDLVKTSSEGEYIVPNGRRSYDQNDENQYEVPIRKPSDHFYMDLADDPEDHSYSEINLDEEVNTNRNDNKNKIHSSKSKGFDSVESARRIPSRSTISSRIDEARRLATQNGW